MNIQLIEQAQALQEESQALEERLQFIAQQFEELTALMTGIDILPFAPQKEMLSSLGKGLFVKTQFEDKQLYVDIGAGVIVKKTPVQVQEIIRGQLRGLMELREETQHRLIELKGEFENLLGQLQNVKA